MAGAIYRNGVKIADIHSFTIYIPRTPGLDLMKELKGPYDGVITCKLIEGEIGRIES